MMNKLSFNKLQGVSVLVFVVSVLLLVVNFISGGQSVSNGIHLYSFGTLEISLTIAAYISAIFFIWNLKTTLFNKLCTGQLALFVAYYYGAIYLKMEESAIKIDIFDFLYITLILILITIVGIGLVACLINSLSKHKHVSSFQWICTSVTLLFAAGILLLFSEGWLYFCNFSVCVTQMQIL